MNKKYITIFSVLIIFLIIFLCACIRNKNEIKATETTYVSKKEFKNFDFHNYPVENDEHIEQKEEISEQKNNKPKFNFSLKNIQTKSYQTKATKYSSVKEKTIPSWVYNNTYPYDEYANVIRSNKNVIFAFYTTSQKQHAGKAMIKRAIHRYDIDNFIDRSVVRPANITSIGCTKSSSDIYCQNVPGMQQEIRCKCLSQYLSENCTDRFCLINPSSKSIVFIDFDEFALMMKLNELKDNW